MKVTVDQFAKHMGVSRPSIQYHLRKGTFGDAAVRLESGVWAIDLETATFNYKKNVQGGGSDVRKKVHQARAVRIMKEKAQEVQDEPVVTSLDLPGYIDDLTGAKTKRENYMAEISRLEYEEQIKKLVSSEEVQKALFKTFRELRDSLLNIPGKLAPELASMDDVFAITQFLEKEIRQGLNDCEKSITEN